MRWIVASNQANSKYQQLTDKFSSILPVSLIRFDVNTTGNQFLLEWFTASEVNSAYFDVQSSADGKDFKTIGQVAASGNSYLQKQYGFVFQPASYFNTPTYFRLQIVDKDGSNAYSSIQKANLDGFFNLTVSPNPAIGSVHINSMDIRLLRLLDMSGKIIFQ